MIRHASLALVLCSACGPAAAPPPATPSDGDPVAVDEPSTADPEAEDVDPVTMEAVSALVEALEDEEYVVRCSAMEALGRIGPPALSELVWIAGQGDGDGCAVALPAIAEMGPGARSAVPDLAAMMEDGTCDERDVMDALMAIGEPCEQVYAAVAPVLVKLLDEDYWGMELDPDVQTCMLGQLAGEDAQMVLALLSLLERRDLDGEDWDHVEALLWHPDPDVVLRAAELVIDPYGWNTDEVMPPLLALLDDADPDVRDRALSLIPAAASLPPGALETFTSLLASPIASEREHAVRCMGCFGVDAWKAVPGIAKLVETGDGDLKLAAIASLERIG